MGVQVPPRPQVRSIGPTATKNPTGVPPYHNVDGDVCVLGPAGAPIAIFDTRAAGRCTDPQCRYWRPPPVCCQRAGGIAPCALEALDQALKALDDMCLTSQIADYNGPHLGERSSK